MADRAISALPTATTLTSSDLFVLSQSNQAKNTTWQTIIGYLATALDGHGGIADIEYTAPSTGSLIGTLTITLADGTTDTLSVTNGKGISSIAKTGTAGLVDTYTITYNDTSTSTFQVTNGAKGDQGEASYVHIKWAAEEPTQDSDMEITADAWIGIHVGTEETAPTHYTDYTWYEYKGEKGDTGTSITSVTFYSSSGLVDTYRVNFDDGTYTSFTVTNGSSIDYIAKTATSGLTDTYTVYLTDGTNTTFNVINGKGISSITEVDVTHAAGHTDVYRFNFNDGDTYTFSIYNGSNGSGSVSTVDGIAADNQNVPLLILGQGAPTTSTSGTLKQRYFDQTNSILYILTGIDTSGQETTYNWQGAGVTVDSALSTMSTNPVQNAVLATIIGTGSLNTTAQNLVGAVNELKIGVDGNASDISALTSNALTKQLSNSFFYGLYGKTLNILGDSISNNNDDWVGYIPTENNITLNNISVAGIKISGSGGLATKTAELSQSADINVLFAGTNDYNAQASIGTITDTSVNTFYGALNALFTYFAINIPNSITYIVTPLKRSLVANASVPMEVYCNALYKIANKYGAIVLDAYHNAPDWNPLVSDLAHWCNSDLVHPLPPYNQKFLMPYIMRGLSSGSNDIGKITKADFNVSVNSSYYITPVSTVFEVDSDGNVNILLTGTFRNSESTAKRVVIANLPQWAATGKQEWGGAGVLTTGAITNLPFYVSGTGGLTIDLTPGDHWCFAYLRYKI